MLYRNKDGKDSGCGGASSDVFLKSIRVMIQKLKHFAPNYLIFSCPSLLFWIEGIFTCNTIKKLGILHIVEHFFTIFCYDSKITNISKILRLN